MKDREAAGRGARRSPFRRRESEARRVCWERPFGGQPSLSPTVAFQRHSHFKDLTSGHYAGRIGELERR
jgi:hypothetical protein